MGGINGINAVPMDYFLRGVDAVREAEGKANAMPVPGADRNGTTTTTTAAPRAGGLVQQLDVLLVRAAKLSTQSLTWTSMAQPVKTLVEAGILTKDEAANFEKAAKTAVKTFKALDSLTGAQLSEAIVVDGKGRMAVDENSKYGKKVSDAINAQSKLSQMLADVGRRLWDDTTVPDAVSDALMEMRQKCDRRTTEIQSLAFQMREFTMHAETEGQSVDPNVAVILKATAKELLPRQAVAMHGTPEALEQLNATFTEKLRPLAERIDAFTKNPSTAAASSAELDSLRADITRMREAVTDIRKNGLEISGGKIIVDKDVLKGLDAVLDYAEKAFANARRTIANAVRHSMYKTVESLVGAMSEARMNEIVSQHPGTLPLFNKSIEFINALDEYVNCAARDDLSVEAKQFFEHAMHLSLQLRAEVGRVGVDFKEAKAIGKDFVTFMKNARGAHTFMPPFADVTARLRGADAATFLTGAEARAVFDGRIQVSSLVEARVRGLRDSDVNPATSDANLVSAERLGAGAAGTVYALTYANGDTLVFKGETESRNGLARIQVGSGNAYSLRQKTVNLNIASRAVADRLGCGDLIVKYSAGMHADTFGFFMEKAPGMSAKSYTKHPEKAPPGGLSANEVRTLPPAERRAILAEIKRKLNRLQWLDAVTGQQDRHFDNYFIHIDKETHKVTVKGIDNDASFSTIRTGAGRFELDEKRSRQFEAEVKAFATILSPSDADLVAKQLLQDPGIEPGPNETYVVNVDKLKVPFLAGCLGNATASHNGVVPDRIDREFRNEILALKQGSEKREAFLKDLEDRMDKTALAAAERRLDSVIAAAEAIGEDDIIAPNDWLDVPEPPRPRGEVHLTLKNGMTATVPEEVAESMFDILSGSLFTRDSLNEFF